MLVAERGLAHAGTAGKDHQVGIMQPADLGVEPVEAGGDAREMPARFERPLGHLHRQRRGLGEALHPARHIALLGDLVQRDLGRLDAILRIDLLAGVERALDHVAADLDQRAQQREIVDLLREVARADQRRAAVGQPGEIGRAAELAHRLVGLEHRPERDRIGDQIAVDHPQYGVVDPPVQRLEEMLGAELELDILDQPIVDHQRAEQRGLGLDILGQGAPLRPAA